MEYLISGTTSTYYPTYMNPENGAIFPPSTSSSYATATRSTYAVGAAYETSVESYNYQQISSSSASPADADPSVAYDINESSYSEWLATANVTDLSPSSSTTNSSLEQTESSSSSTGMSPLKIATFGVPAIVGFVLLVVGIWCCCRCRRRRKERRNAAREQERGEGYGEMREDRAGTGILPRYDQDQRPSSLTRDEVMGVISSGPGSVSIRRPAQTQSAWPYGQPEYPDNNRRYLTPSVGGSRHSRWTDDTEFDVVAEDGSTITRTLSTTSTRRSLATSEVTAIGDNVNPFDHPAYTYRSAPQQLSRGQTPALSRNGTLSSGSGTGTGTGTWSSQLPPLSFQSTQSPISPLTPTAVAPPYIQPHLSQSRDRQDTYSTHSSEDGDIFNGRPGLRREPTIIRHSDSTFAQGRGSATVEKRGRDGVVELPPLYEDATSGWSR